MATNKAYNALIAMPAGKKPSMAALNKANRSFKIAEKGDGNPLPQPFTYGKIYTNGPNGPNASPVAKISVAPEISPKELLNIVSSVPNRPLLFDKTSAPSLRSQNWLAVAKASVAKKQRSKVRRRIGKRIQAKLINKQLMKTQYKNQNNYTMLIELSTNVTGKHTIFYSSKLTSALPHERLPGPLTQQQTHMKSAGLWDYPTISRKDKTFPYTNPRTNKNQQWTQISKEIQAKLVNLFSPDKELSFPNPTYPTDRKRDLVFKIGSYQWVFLPRRLELLTGKDKFKFYITYNTQDFKDPIIYIIIKVHLTGQIMKRRMLTHITTPLSNVGNVKAQPVAMSFCNKRFRSLKNMFLDSWTNAGIFSDSASEKFEQKVKRARATERSTKGLKLYYKNKQRALNYWIQEYYCRQAANFKAGLDADWPNVSASPSRFPFDPWTLQPGIPGSYKVNGANAPEYAALVTAYNAFVSPRNRPVWPIPFAPFGMALKPKMIPILFNRLNNLINNAGIAGQPPVTGEVLNAATNLRAIMYKNKLPRLATITDVSHWTDLFILYEFALNNKYKANHNKQVLEPYPPYPVLAQPEAGQPFGIWTTDNGAKKQWAIPVVSGNASWSADANPPAFLTPPAVLRRPKVTWQQIKKNGFYQEEAKKWASWMVLACPFPIPGFPQYFDYIILKQNYVLYKLNGVSPVPVPAASWTLTPPFPNNNGLLPPVEERTQYPLPLGTAPTLFTGWNLPGASNRSPQYINPYAPISQIGAAGWNKSFVLNFSPIYPPAAGPVTGWNVYKQLFLGPPANKYPVLTWPKNNMKRFGHGQVFMPVKELFVAYTKRSKSAGLGSWMGGKKTLKRRRRKKNNTLKKRQ